MGRNNAFLLVFIFFGAIAFRIPSLISAAYVNEGLMQVFDITPCDPQWYVCAQSFQSAWYPPMAWNGNESELEGILRLFKRASLLDPNSKIAHLHLAEILFSLKHYPEAAIILIKHGLLTPDASISNELESNGEVSYIEHSASILTPGSYEYHLLYGYHLYSEQHFQEAVHEFDIALSLAGERIPQQVQHDFYQVLASWYLELSQQEPVEKCWSARYFLLSGEVDKAIEAIVSLGEIRTELQNTDVAWCFFYLGQAYQSKSQISAALESYSEGWKADPQVRLNAIYLIDQLRKNGAEEAAAEIENELLKIGPKYRHGPYQPGSPYTSITQLPSGYGFVGYDMDGRSISHAVPTEIWLWWQKPENFSSTNAEKDWLEISNYLVESQQVTNLVPNNSFELGEKPDGVPIGWSWRMYSQLPQSLFVQSISREGETSKALVASNETTPSSGLMGEEFPVEMNEWYLMAGWMNQDQSPNSNIGRICSGTQFKARGPYYASWLPESALGGWIHVADLAPTFPNDYPERCRITLINFENPGGTTIWDDLLFARISVP